MIKKHMFRKVILFCVILSLVFCNTLMASAESKKGNLNNIEPTFSLTPSPEEQKRLDEANKLPAPTAWIEGLDGKKLNVR